MAGRCRSSCKSLPTPTGKSVVDAAPCCSQYVDTKCYLELKSPGRAVTSLGVMSDSRLDILRSQTPPTTVTSVKTDASTTTSAQKSTNTRNVSDLIRPSRTASDKARPRRVPTAQTHTELTDSTASINNPLAAETRRDLTSLPAGVKNRVCRKGQPLRCEAKRSRTTNDDLVPPAAAAATSDVNNAPITLTISHQSQEKTMVITKEFCRKLDRESLVANVYYSDIDSLVHIEVREENKQKAEKFTNELKATYETEKGYSPNYIIELYEPGEYIQTCSPPRNNEEPTTTASVEQAKPTLRPGTHIKPTTTPNRCLFSGTLNGNKGISVGHAFEVGQEVETVQTEHHPEAYSSTFGRCVRVFDSITNNQNETVTADMALIEIDPRSCNPENTVQWPSRASQSVKVYRGDVAVHGNTQVMIVDQRNEIKYGFIRGERSVRAVLRETDLHNMLAISSHEEFMRQEAITEPGDSGALVMSVPGGDGSGNSGDIDVYGIVTGLRTFNSSSLTVANDLPKVLSSLSEMDELPQSVDFQ